MAPPSSDRPSSQIPHAGRSSLELIPPVLVVALFVAPLALVVLGSLRPTGTAPPTSVDLWPADAGASNYRDLFGRPAIQQQLLNSLLIAAIAVPLGTLVASWAGYAIARLPRPASLVLLGITLIAVAIPTSTVFVGRLVVFRLAGLTDTPVPLIAPALIGVSPLLILLFAWSYHTVPREIYDLATGAGLGPFGTWWRVALPMRTGAVAVAVAVAFVASWGNLSDPLLYVYDERWFTLPLGLASLAVLPPTDQGLMLAGAVVAIAPALVTAFIVQRHLLERRG
jgi:multiple sugar transport system permease protein